MAKARINKDLEIEKNKLIYNTRQSKSHFILNLIQIIIEFISSY